MIDCRRGIVADLVSNRAAFSPFYRWLLLLFLLSLFILWMFWIIRAQRFSWLHARTHWIDIVRWAQACVNPTNNPNYRKAISALFKINNCSENYMRASLFVWTKFLVILFFHPLNFSLDAFICACDLCWLCNIQRLISVPWIFIALITWFIPFMNRWMIIDNFVLFQSLIFRLSERTVYWRRWKRLRLIVNYDTMPIEMCVEYTIKQTFLLTLIGDNVFHWNCLSIL